MTFYEGFSTYTITVPMPYAIRFFAEGLLISMQTLHNNEDVSAKLSVREGEQIYIHKALRKSLDVYDEFLHKQPQIRDFLRGERKS
ncbi:MAG: hypothetical protein ACTSXS_00025 [Candidatus Thorarchaeota archaeon]